MNLQAQNLLNEINDLLNQLEQDCRQDVWYDSAVFEKEYPDDSYTETQNRICVAPLELRALIHKMSQFLQ